MGKALSDEFDSARRAFDEAEEAFGGGLKEIIFNGPIEALGRTETTQPALLAAGIAAYRVFSENFDVTPAFMAGHSLGEYTALVAAGAIDFKDAIRIVRMRGRFMQESVPEGTGKMVAVIGLDNEVLRAICKDVSDGDDVVVAANLNSPGQVVLSGAINAVTKAGEKAKAKGARRVLDLPVSVPSHSPLMKPAAVKLAEELANIDIKAPSVPVISNVTAGPVEDPAEVRILLEKQLTNPVRWVETVQKLAAEGVEAAIEIGPGKVLSGLVKRTEKSIATANFAEPGDIEKVRAALT
jgi:[acyl-carrier-protein] S-malonyltransferase